MIISYLKMKTKDYLLLIRPSQWYKNLVIFLAIIFSGNILDINMMISTVIAFVIFVLASSSNYIINDVFDRKKDIHNPEKRKRPIASGRIGVREGLFFSVMLLLVSILISYLLSTIFVYIVLVFFILTLMYSIYLKNIPIIDVIMISINFAIRAIAGAIAISVTISPWLVLCPFFIALILGLAKRYGEIKSLGGTAKKHRSVLGFYNKNNTRIMILIASILLLVSYTLFSFYSVQNQAIFYTIIFVTIGITVYLKEAMNKSSVCSRPNLIFKNNIFNINLGLYLISSFIVIYFL